MNARQVTRTVLDIAEFALLLTGLAVRASGAIALGGVRLAKEALVERVRARTLEITDNRKRKGWGK